MVPLRQQGELIGTLTARRIEVRPFTPAQIKLLETFADQAVIAIENVRLFQELKEVIGAADSDERNLRRHRELADGYPASARHNRGKRCAAMRLDDAQIYRVEGDVCGKWQATGLFPDSRSAEAQPISRGSVTGRAMLDVETVHVQDIDGRG